MHSSQLRTLATVMSSVPVSAAVLAAAAVLVSETVGNKFAFISISAANFSVSPPSEVISFLSKFKVPPFEKYNSLTPPAELVMRDE